MVQHRFCGEAWDDRQGRSKNNATEEHEACDE